MYQELFKFLHRQGRRRRIAGVAKTLTYSQFTPPWIRRSLAVRPPGRKGEEVVTVAETVYLKKLAITHLRNERNTQGYRRVRFILAAFFIQELASVKPLLEHLMRTAPAHRPSSRRKTGKKRPVQSAHNANATGGSERSNKRIATRERDLHAIRNHNNAREDRETVQDAQREPSTTPETAPGPEGDQSPEKNTSCPSLVILRPRLSLSTPDTASKTKPAAKQNLFQFAEPKSALKSKSVFEGLLDRGSNSLSQECSRSLSTEAMPGRETLQRGVQSPEILPDTRSSELVDIEKQLREAQEEENGKENQGDDESYGDEPYDDEEDESANVEIPANCPIKRGALMNCFWKVSDMMQRTKELKANCTKCNVPMHIQCHRPRRLCNKCLKKKVFENIYRSERRFLE